MILHSIATNLRKQNWSVVFVELLVVVIGLVLAFQVDRWWEARGEHLQEQEYIARLMVEVEADIGLISYAIELAEVRQGFADLLIETASNPAAAEQQPGMFLAAVAQASFTYTPSLTAHTFEDLRSTGGMGLIRSAEIKDAMFDYYGFHDSQQQFMQLNLMNEHHYFELSASVLNAAQYQWVQDNWFVVAPNDLDEVRGSSPDLSGLPGAIERFTGNQPLVDWLPRTRGLQREQILMHGIRLSRAQELLEQLKIYAEKLAGEAQEVEA